MILRLGDKRGAYAGHQDHHGQNHKHALYDRADTVYITDAPLFVRLPHAVAPADLIMSATSDRKGQKDTGQPHDHIEKIRFQLHIKR